MKILLNEKQAVRPRLIRRRNSQKVHLLALVALLFGLFAQLSYEPAPARAAGFTPGNLVVVRVGDGSAALSSAATAVFLDEYSTGGGLAQTIAMPTTVSGANARLTNSGSATSEGALARSADGRYLTLAGYDATLGTTGIASTSSATANRVIARVDAAGNVDTSTKLTDANSGNNIRSAYTSNGTDIWTAGAGNGVRYSTLGATTSAQVSSSVTNIRVVNAFNNQLFVTSASGTFLGISSVGSGLPTTTGNTITPLPGFPTTTGPSPYGFAIPTSTTAFVADDRAIISGGGIQRWDFNGTTWVLSYTLNAGLTTGTRGLAVTNDGGTFTIYATTAETSANKLVKITDTGAASTFTTIATAPANTVFRGVAFAPSGSISSVAPTITTQPGNQTIETNQNAILTVAASGTAPLSYQWYKGSSGDISNPVGTNSSSYTTDPLTTGSYNYWVRVSNTTGQADSTTATVTVNPPVQACSTSYIPINQVQGSGNAAAITGNVTVKGVVVGDNEGTSPALRGFYLEDLQGDQDNDPATSEGIFIFEGNNADTVSLGDVVQVTGTAAEFQDQTQLTATKIEKCGATGSVAPVDVTLPFPADANGVPYFERFEGMLVRFPQTLYVTEMFQLGRFGQVVMSANGRLSQPTNIVDPGAPAQTLQATNNLNRIIVDDATNDQNPDPILFGRGGNPLTASNTLRGGDSATGMVGVMTYTWGGNSASGNAYRLRPVNALGGGVPNFQPTDPRPAGPLVVGGRLKVASFNVLNYFLTLDIGTQANCGPIGFKQECRGAETADELTRQQQKLNAALLNLDGDIVGMMELENSQNAQGQDVNPLADIVGRLNASLGGDVNGYIDTGVIGTDTIRVGIIYKKAKVTPVANPLVDLDPVNNRPPVAQLFSENGTGEQFTVIVNHLKSKGCPGSGADADQGDGQGCWNATRVDQAKRLLTFINSTVLPTSKDPDVLLIGDFNSYAKEDPIKTLQAGGYFNLVAKYSGPEAYSYAFDGQWGYLDQGLASASLLAQSTGAGDYHINSDEPSVLDYNTNFKSVGQVASLYAADEFRTSDHDPVVIGLNLQPVLQATNDNYTVEAGKSTNLPVLSNDTGGSLQVVSNTNPANGTVTLNPDGTFTYTSKTGYTGSDSFEYTVSNPAVTGVQLYKGNAPALDTIGGVKITGNAFGSSVYPVPGTTDEFYGLTDRGPNVDGPNGSKVEPMPNFTPSIGKYKFVNGVAVLEQVIPLKAANGTPFNGRVSIEASTGETIYDLNGNVLTPDPNGYDSEGLVALPDGTFWVSDEYGPYITHFDATGKEIERLSPFNGKLPVELKNRLANRGMEGLTITPDGSTLVGIMQSALQQPDLAGYDAKKITILRIVTYKLATGEVHEYLYLLDNPITTKTAVSEIAAISNTTFLVIERDGNFPPGAYKKLFKIDISGATDIGPSASVSGAVYDGANGGLLIGGKSLELLLKGQDTAALTATLTASGIKPTGKSLFLDLTALLTNLDPKAGFFSHDKIEGVAVLNGGSRIVLSNDSDFGIDGLSNSATPYQLHTKTSPVTGTQDDGEFLAIDLSHPTATVTIKVVDTIAPDTTIDSAPANPAKNNGASFSFSGTDSGSGVAGFECALDGAAFAACTSPQNYTNLADGSHTVAVRAIDKAGNIDPDPASYTWLVDTTPPVTGDNAPVTWQKADFSITLICTDGGSGCTTTSYRIDGGSWQTGNTVAINSEGDHLVEYYSTDKVGNTETTHSIRAKLDKTIPVINLTAPAEGTVFLQDEVVKVTYTCNDSLSGIATCNGSIQTGKQINTAKPGYITLTVTATDNAGNVTTVTRNYRVLAPRDYLVWVRDNLVALRSTLNGPGGKLDALKLDEAIKSLNRAIDSSLWTNAGHPKRGEMVYLELNGTVNTLRDLQQNKKSLLDDGVLQVYIIQLTATTREIASIAIADALAAGGKDWLINFANQELVAGDKDIAGGRYTLGILHYQAAWSLAVLAK